MSDEFFPEVRNAPGRTLEVQTVINSNGEFLRAMIDKYGIDETSVAHKEFGEALSRLRITAKRLADIEAVDYKVFIKLIEEGGEWPSALVGPTELTEDEAQQVKFFLRSIIVLRRENQILKQRLVEMDEVNRALKSNQVN